MMKNDAESRGNRFWVAFAVAWVGVLGVMADSIVIAVACFVIVVGLLLSTVDKA